MTKTPKALFHPDGQLFVIWHDDHQAYCPVISDEDAPPTLGSLGIRDYGFTDHSALVWRPIRMTVTEAVVHEEVLLAPYDTHTGEHS